MDNKIIEIISDVAKIPSFTGQEEILHPYISNFIEENKIDCAINKHYNNLIIEVNKDDKVKPIAFAAHLDKINHLDGNVELLPFEIEKDFIKGQLDDSVGVGICLYLLMKSKELNLPYSLFLFSEMEEGIGLRKFQLLNKDDLIELKPQIGAERISEFLIANSFIPSLIITIDTTPLFGGDSGIALYSRFWERTGTSPSQELIKLTETIENKIKSIHPDIKLSNNVNDYITFGRVFSQNHFKVPSIAIEPSIYPYHTIGEKVFISDIHKTIDIISRFVRENFLFNNSRS
jgi:putative aminopeptidase FrvX